MYVQPVTMAVQVHYECALMTYSKIQNSEDEKTQLKQIKKTPNTFILKY